MKNRFETGNQRYLMNHKAKNAMIVFLFAVVVFLSILLFIQGSGRYCKPVIKEAPHAENVRAADSTLTNIYYGSY